MSQRILITGCSSGIGRALAAELANRGHEVIATTRLGEGLEDLGVAHRLALDVTSTASVEAAAHAIGPVDVVVNNAGVTIWGAVEAPGEAEVQRLFDTNVFGPLRVLRAILPAMREQGHGAIYQISSAAAKRSTALLGHYAASKAALDAYSEALRIELAPFGIAVCIVSLGPVESSFGVNRREFTPPPSAELTHRANARTPPPPPARSARTKPPTRSSAAGATSPSSPLPRTTWCSPRRSASFHWPTPPSSPAPASRSTAGKAPASNAR